MAKTALVRSPVIIQMPRRRGGRVRRAGRRALGFARRIRHSRHTPGMGTMSLLLGGAALGWVEQKGYIKRLPQIGGSGAASLVAAGYAASKYGRHKALKTLGYAAMVVGAFDFGRVQAGGTSGLDEVDQFGEHHG